MTQAGVGTNLGYALTQILSDQFSELRGLRPAQYGFPKILIVMTDGKSSDQVDMPAANLHESNIVVYAIGIGNYDSDQLNAVASSQEHVKILATFFDLTDFAATLTASTCNEPQPIVLEMAISGRVDNKKYQYYVFIISVDDNLKVEVVDNEGSTLVYASRDNPNPYEYDNDFGFSSGSQTTKEIVISPITRGDIKQQARATDGNITYPIYVSVEGVTSTASYTLMGSTCDPANCTEGTNESSGATFPRLSPTSALVGVAVTIISNYLC